ncbi:unnamed protein product [Orchesella dallaii]|uniref:Maltase-glucoamylase, intestinal n=1 Tax=Orchesella dallaii TaxID=48710 RepID=A0ABP1RWZ9_9HEXA
MGGWISNVKPQDDQENLEQIRRYEEKIYDDGTFGYSDELDKRKVGWLDQIIYNPHIRIFYVLILALILGIVIPMIIFITKLENDDRTIYGSCLINENARFECLLNAAEIVDKETCYRALCCWEDSVDLEFNCYHSFPSAYQYTTSNVQVNTINGTEYTSVDTTQNHPDRMAALKVLTHWEAEDHLVVEVFNKNKFPSRGQGQSEASRKQGGNKKSSITADEPLVVEWGNANSYFYIRVGRHETDETIFDTRLGPVIVTDNYIAFATTLSTPYFLGLKGGQGAVSSLKYGVINGFESAELPFYISYEKSGHWHGVLIDTTDPMVVQVVQAPGIMFHVETDFPELNLHFFPGPTQADIISQLHNHIRKKHSIDRPPVIPPYWGLGLHLCRKADNGSVVLDELTQLFQENKAIAYDSDCIEEYLRHPIDEERFENLTDILTLLKENSKKVVLSQKVTAPWDTGEIDLIYDDDVWLQNGTNLTNTTPLLGKVDNVTVTYFDFFNPKLSSFPIMPNISLLNGLSLSENFPILYNNSICQTPESLIQAMFTTSNSSTTNLNSSLYWTSMCPEALHTVRYGDNGAPTYTSHLTLHNTYGEQALKTVYTTLADETLNPNGTEMLVTSSSIWTSSMYYGGFNGLQVPFSWKGLQDSVAYAVRNYALSPMAGTPICGSMIFNMTIQKDNDLCLRWFQFGLLLPIARNSYDGNSSYGPLDLPDQYRGYVNSTIRKRYTYAPYYYTTLRQYQKDYIPIIKPMSFYFNFNAALTLVDQFMIGEAILAAPIIDRSVNRRAYFPPAVWYTVDGNTAWNSSNVGATQQITGHITETPLFFRGGYIIPTLLNPEGTSIEESLGGIANYTLIVALAPRRNSTGKLEVKSPHAENETHYVDFEARLDTTSNTFVLSVNATCGSPNSTAEDATIRTTIDQVRILGLPFAGTLNITMDVTEDQDIKYIYYYFGEENAVRIPNLNVNWCVTNRFEMIVTQSIETRR